MREKMTQNKQTYLAPDTRAVRIAVESSVCASSNVKEIKTEKPDIEVDDWDEIGNDISFD